MKKILIIFGGNSFEHNISCLSVNNVIKNIDKKRYNFDVVGISRKNAWFLIKNHNNITSSWEKLDKEPIIDIIAFLKKYDKIFPVMHGSCGEDGKIQSLFELFNLSYVGSNSNASKNAMDKHLTKLLCEKEHIPQVPYFVMKKNTEIPSKLDYPLIIKPANGGSSIGINVAHNKKEMHKFIKKALKFDHKIVVEKFINCRELECAIIEGKNLIVSTIGEIESCNEFYDFEAKYEKESHIIIPASLNQETIIQIQNLAKKVFKLLELKDFARIDFLYDETNNKIYFNEVNTIPGFTNISMFPLLFKEKGLDFKKLITKIIEN